MKVSNKAIARAFRNAVPALSHGPISSRSNLDKYICRAICNTNASGPNSYAVTREARAIIQSRISPYSTLDGWLRSQGIKVGDKVTVAIQKHRHAWLQMLIKEFENKE